MIKLFKIMKFYIRLHIYLLSSICSICSESLKNRVKRLISKNRQRQFCLIYQFFSFCNFSADAASAFNLNLYYPSDCFPTVSFCVFIIILLELKSFFRFIRTIFYYTKTAAKTVFRNKIIPLAKWWKMLGVFQALHHIL